MVSLYRFHGFKQGMFERSLPYTSYRQAGKCYCRPSSDELLRYHQGYHQIPLALEGQEKTNFVTPTGNYHFKVIPFGLKMQGSLIKG